MKTKQLPAIVMLTAGLIDCIFAIKYKLEFGEFVTQLLIVLLVFYFIGIVAKIVLDMFLAEKPEDTKEETTEETVESQEAEKENIEADEV